MRSALTVLAVAITALACTVQAASALKPGQAFGVGDQNEIVSITDPRYAALKPSITRQVVAWDLALGGDPARTKFVDDWYADALATKQRPMLALDGLDQRKVPSVAQYSQALKALLMRYPKVDITPWNEANHSRQPTAKRPKDVAKLFRAARTIARGRVVTSPSIVINAAAASWADTFVRAAKVKPTIWALHTYQDANHGRATQTDKFLRKFRYGKVWLTETAAWARFGTMYPFSLDRQAKITRLIFRDAVKNKRVARLYWYEWTTPVAGTAYWDSAFFNSDGTSRPAYQVALAERFKKR